jgi:3-oxoacyl-[acyl-carrier protein] reductase
VREARDAATHAAHIIGTGTDMDTNNTRKTAIIFGGSRGIGAAAVTRLAEDGFAVAFTYAARGDKARELVEAVTATGGEALAIQAESADPLAIAPAVEQAVDRFGKITAVVVNAGILRLGAVDKVPLAELDLMLHINIRAVFLSIQAVLPRLGDGGRIITIGSNVAIQTGFPGSSVYQMTKGAVATTVKGLALDLAPRTITVNNVQPGPTDTDINAGAVDILAGKSPLQRVARPSEIAGLISYLAGQESGYMTGSSLTIDGGFTL